MRRFLYTLLWHAALPLVFLRLAWRARHQPEYLRHLSERFGASPLTAGAPTIWLHAVSVGETRAALPLIQALLATYPSHCLLLTHMTPTGRATGADLVGNNPRVIQSYLPYDLPWAMRRFFCRSQPALGIIMETEVWPNCLATAKKVGVPVMLANARLSARSARGYQRLGHLARDAFANLSLVSAQNAADQERLSELGAQQVNISGNIKFELTFDETQRQLGATFRASCAGRPVLLLASTREAEEEDFLKHFAAQADPAVLLVIVPRHPQRFDAVAKLIVKQGLNMERRSATTSILPSTRVWLGDSMGEMEAYCAMADVAIIGGSWQNLGGHNPLEACALGVPVIVGPHTFNFAQICEEAVASGAAVRCPDAAAAISQALTWLQNRQLRTQVGQAGKDFIAAHQGATARTLALVAQLLPPPSARAAH